jgi:hypothetical protein
VIPRLVRDYRPGQPHGWPGRATVGGHVSAGAFDHNGRSYRVSLAAAEYAAAPSVGFVRTVEDAFGGFYTFRYGGGLPAFRVQSYSVVTSPSSYGAELYVVHEDGPDPALALRWIQVVRTPGRSFVDNGGRANPFLPTGGPTSVHGERLLNLYTVTEIIPPPDAPDLSGDYAAEVFLAHDTGAGDPCPVVVTGGIRYGWQVRAA